MQVRRRRPKKLGNYAFVDSQNLNLGTQKMGWKVDWRKFRKYLQDKHGVSKAYLFIGYIPEFEDMYMQLHELGYLIVLKPTQDLAKMAKEEAEDEKNGEADKDKDKQEDKKPVKGNIDAELVLWAVKEMKNYDKAVIVSGDGDFYCLAEYLEQEKKLQKILVPNWQYSSLLKPYTQYIERIDTLRQHLAYRKSGKPRAKKE